MPRCAGPRANLYFVLSEQGGLFSPPWSEQGGITLHHVLNEHTTHWPTTVPTVQCASWISAGQGWPIAFWSWTLNTLAYRLLVNIGGPTGQLYCVEHRLRRYVKHVTTHYANRPGNPAMFFVAWKTYVSRGWIKDLCTCMYFLNLNKSWTAHATNYVVNPATN